MWDIIKEPSHLEFVDVVLVTMVGTNLLEKVKFEQLWNYFWGEQHSRQTVWLSKARGDTMRCFGRAMMLKAGRQRKEGPESSGEAGITGWLVDHVKNLTLHSVEIVQLYTVSIVFKEESTVVHKIHHVVKF